MLENKIQGPQGSPPEMEFMKVHNLEISQHNLEISQNLRFLPSFFLFYNAIHEQT
jgi:hypothetical protein